MIRAGVFERLYAEAYKEPNFAQKQWEDTCKRKSIQPQWRPVRTWHHPASLVQTWSLRLHQRALLLPRLCRGLSWLTEAAGPVCSCRRTVQNRR